MGMLFRSAVALGLAAGLGLPASGQGERCTHDALGIDGSAVSARFCVAVGASPANVSVAETFTSHGKSIAKTTPLTIVAGAQTSRTIDDIDLAPLGLKHT